MVTKITCQQCEDVLRVFDQCTTCKGCIIHCRCTSMDCDCDTCCERYEIWREGQVALGYMEPRNSRIL